MLTWIHAGAAGGAALAKPNWASQMGLVLKWKLWGGFTGGGAGGNFSAPYDAKAVVSQHIRPSHDATKFRGHWTRWGDNKRQPIPFGRGVPFRGDMLGYAGFGAQAIWGL